MFLEENPIPTSSQPVADVLRIDAAKEVDGRIAHMIRDVVLKQFKRKGAVVGVSEDRQQRSGSAVSTMLWGRTELSLFSCPRRSLPQITSSSVRMLIRVWGIAAVTEDITSILEGAGLRRRDEAIRSVVRTARDTNARLR